ncbi:hypothetical protein AAFC00_004539 [Neodothiora populina]|uniref:NAD(P)-binding domain-containing protein n=1 Tax=Neodothiora populina TaxID=2781224 RepID=A0ABR3P352_9PEZI
MASTKVLLLGGHGKVALHLTPLLLARQWHVTSVIRNPDHKREILAAGKDQPGKLDVLVESLDEVKSDADAQRVIDKVNPEIVIWSAGAGGKGGAERTYAIDRDAAKHYITSAVSTPSVKKFLMVSYLSSRKNAAPWWTEADKENAHKVNYEILPDYYKAKVAADEHLLAVAHKRASGGDKQFQAINLRPGNLADDAPTGKVWLGKTSSKGKIPRGDVAAVAAALIERNDTRGWYDLLEGETPIAQAIDELVKSGHDDVEGEDLDRIYAGKA